MGTTLEAMLWDGEKLAVAHLGDSRMYRLRDGELTQISTDHTFVQSLVDEGKLTPAEARVHPHRSLLLRAMLGRDDNERRLQLDPAACSATATCCAATACRTWSTDQLIERAMLSETIDMAATELVRLALEGGGHDNVTVVIAEFVDADAEPDDAPVVRRRPAAAGRRRRRQARPRTGPGRRRRHDDEPVGGSTPRSCATRPVRRAGGAGPTLHRGRPGASAILAAGALRRLPVDPDQYYVAASDGKVAIYQGVHGRHPRHHAAARRRGQRDRDDSLPDFRRQQVDAGIEASSRADAEPIVANLDQFGARTQPSPRRRPD